MRKNIIVTGGAGYIGSMTSKVLKQYGYNPIVVDNLCTGFQELVKFGPFEKGDIGDIFFMKSVFKKYKPLSVIHFAASTSVGESTTRSYEYYYNNTVNTLNMLKAMLEENVHNIVFSSTAALFGNPEHSLVKENDIIKPINPYGKSKAAIEYILEDFDLAYGLKYSTLRYFNVVGADPEMEIGEKRLPGLNLFPIIFYNATRQKSIQIFGDNYDTKDGTCIRDYIHVKDLAVAHILAMEKLLDNKESVKLNLGNGVGYSVKEIIEKAKKVMNIDFKVEIVPKRKGDPARLISDISFSRKYLKWNPIYTDVSTSLEHAWSWFKKTNNIVK